MELSIEFDVPPRVVFVRFCLGYQRASERWREMF